MSKVKPSLSVLITCKNERRHIVSCIRSAKAVAAEILVADSGSDDGTLDLVQQAGGCRLIEREYVNSGNFKNWAIPQASQPWVFALDADERIGPQLAAEIIERMNQPLEQYDGFWVPRRNFFLGRQVRFGDWGGDRVLRLFRRDVARYYEYTDHSEIQLDMNRVGRLRSSLIHHAFVDYRQYLDKLHRYARQQAELWHAEGRRPGLARMAANMPARFFRSYVLRGGFLDGSVGFQLAVHTAYYSFLKQAELWALWNRELAERAAEATDSDEGEVSPVAPAAQDRAA